MNVLSEEIAKFHEQLDHERQQKEVAQEMLTRLIEEISERVDDMLQSEIQQREETEERLIELLENTCTRVERSLRHQ